MLTRIQQRLIGQGGVRQIAIDGHCINHRHSKLSCPSTPPSTHFLTLTGTAILSQLRILHFNLGDLQNRCGYSRINRDLSLHRFLPSVTATVELYPSLRSTDPT